MHKQELILTVTRPFLLPTSLLPTKKKINLQKILTTHFVMEEHKNATTCCSLDKLTEEMSRTVKSKDVTLSTQL